SGSGVFISEVVRGGAAELDGRLMQGDQILSVDGEDTRHASQEAVAAMLKVSHAEVRIHTHAHTLLSCWPSSSALAVPSGWSWDDSKLLPGFRLEGVR
ncbi:unnamed protein product, partial [Tetraodon nigroviridis]